MEKESVIRSLRDQKDALSVDLQHMQNALVQSAAPCHRCLTASDRLVHLQADAQATVGTAY